MGGIYSKILLLSLSQVFLLSIFHYFCSFKILENENLISVLIVMLISMTAYKFIFFHFKDKNRVFLTGIVIGAKFLVYLLYLFLMILFFKMWDQQAFVIIFMLIYFSGTIQLTYFIYNKLKFQ